MRAGNKPTLGAPRLGNLTLTGGFPGYGGIPPAVAAVGSAGVAATVSRSDHTHAFTPSPSSFMVDLISAEQDLETATTFVVVPAVVGARFLPMAAYLELTNVNTLTVGPSLKLGNNVAHDNVAPVLAVANTVVTDDLVPFVMAIAPVVITLTVTGIICELTVNAVATTALGKVHVIGVYI